MKAAANRGLVVLALIPGSGDAVAAARNALSAGVAGVALEGNFPDDTVAAVARAAESAPVISLTARNRLARIEDCHHRNLPGRLAGN